ncbi:MAG: lysine 5,6-aminomutase subunit alpha [Candidatus Izimaplasma sp.]|nr:lysine 5,6-aminomutase subunit alpha [Candidatus Izimaplasma bacterium]
MNKLNLSQDNIEKARQYAEIIAQDTQDFIENYTTVSVERTVCRLLGIDGVNDIDIPYPNIVVDYVQKHGDLSKGISRYMASLVKLTGASPHKISRDIEQGLIRLHRVELVNDDEILPLLHPYIDTSLNIIKEMRSKRETKINALQDKNRPLLYVIVATGNIYEDVTQAQAAARNGADVIAVIRTTGQSLLDYVPYGPTTEGFGGTYATQENFKIMREALDDVGEELNKYIMLVNYASGLCMPEIAAMGAMERLDMMLNDSLYGVLFRDINIKRTLIDQYFSRVIHAYAGIIINTGEDNYLTTSDAYEEAHTVLASQFINEQFALKAQMKSSLQGLGHAFEMDPELENGFLYELAQAEMAREIFPDAPLKYMPPTKYMTGNIFKGYAQNTLFNVVTSATRQRIHLLGMLTEAVHTPFMSDRYLAIENAKYIENNMKNLFDEMTFKTDGIIQNRAKHVLTEATMLLKEIKDKTLFTAIEKGTFAGIKRSRDGGKGLPGVILKADDYVNPILDQMIASLKEER